VIGERLPMLDQHSLSGNACLLWRSALGRVGVEAKTSGAHEETVCCLECEAGRKCLARLLPCSSECETDRGRRKSVVLRMTKKRILVAVVMGVAFPKPSLAVLGV